LGQPSELTEATVPDEKSGARRRAGDRLYFGVAFDFGAAGFCGPIEYGLFVISTLGAFNPSSEVVAALGGVTPPPSSRASLFSPQPEIPSKIAAVVPSSTLQIVDFMMFQALL
jgi:hypothetical protein